MPEFKIRYPYQFDEREKPLFEQYDAECEAVNKRGPVDVQALISGTLPEGTPGIGPVLRVTEDMLAYDALKYNPDNPLYNDAEYARKAGYKDVPAMITFPAHDDSFIFAIPHAARDVMLVSNLNHSVTSLKPVYDGDTLYLVVDERHYKDLTPAGGSVYRSIAMSCSGSIYNQDGELVNTVTFRTQENLKTFAEKPETEQPAWEGPPWDKRPAHKYTDEDWDKIRAIWAAEKIRGAEPLYWEDVEIGDEPLPTLDGPVDDTPEPVPPYGMGAGGSRTLRKEIMDPEIFSGMKRNPYDGIYRLEKRSMSYPEPPSYAHMPLPPDGSTPPDTRSFAQNDDPMSEPGRRYMMINFLARDFAIRHFTNWMGDRGWLKNIRWGIMDTQCMEHYGYKLPASDENCDFLKPLPDKYGQCLHHGMERDVILVRSRVYDKHVEGDEHLVELVWWVETILGEMYEAGQATVRLPSRGEKTI